MLCDPVSNSHAGPIQNGTCVACNTQVLGTFFAPPPKTTEGSALDKIIADAIEDARNKARNEILGGLAGIGGEEAVRALISKEAERLLREDPEVKQLLRDAMIRALNSPPRSRW